VHDAVEHIPTRLLEIGEGDSIYTLAFDATIDEVGGNNGANLRDEDLNELFFQTSLAFFMQILIMSIVYKKMPNHDYVEPSTIQMVLRLVMCYLYHLAVEDDIALAFRRLKFLA
jgi:hypothetical protein